MIMRNEEKIRKQKNSQLCNQHKIGLRLLELGVVVGLIYAFGTSFSAVVGVYLGYKVLGLVLKLFHLTLHLVFTLVSIIILIAIISLLIF
jgi:hypothetical protein